ncbi:MAG TPA: matrixin family metalloprotease [Pyrinomonadaceae bacterium]|nr:matrixin family metalloprotease [Pyrinomonadaceae bacterium]
MQYPVAIIISVAMFFSLGSRERLGIRDSFELEPTAQTVRKIRWPRKTIQVSLSTSLLSPGNNIKADSDVVGAARRALSRWASLSNITFVVTWSSATSISPADAGDGISLLTIASTPENEAFNSETTTGRTRVFFDPETGNIAEADISINPRPRAEDGTQLQFSTDGTSGTYDLEATFTHEIGHLLGLDHSAVLSSTMQERQAFNGTFGLPALTERTLSEDDRQKVRSLYGSRLKLGRIEGKLADNRTPGALTPLDGVHIWAESAANGRVIASDITAADGTYKLEGLEPGQYRVFVSSTADTVVSQKFRSFEVSNQVAVKADVATPLNSNLVPPLVSALNPRVIGLNAELSTVALPLAPGKRVKIYLGGEGVDQVPGTSIGVNSPFFTVDPASLTREQIAAPFPVVSIELQVAANAPFGDYSLRLQSNSGETAYVPGAITIDPGVGSSVVNPVDDSRFFITQQYADLAGREPDQATVDKLTAQLSACGTRADCLRARRVEISTNLLLENELPGTGVFLYGLYSTGLSRLPRYTEFESDRATIASQKSELEATRIALAASFVERPEFKRKYPATMKPAEFVDSLLTILAQGTGVDLGSERSLLIGLLDDSANGRAAVLARLASDQRVVDANYNQALVLFQYFSYLRRNPDETAYNTWVNTLKNKPLRDPDAARSLVCNFLNSAEYQNRFGMLATHNPRQCN